MTAICRHFGACGGCTLQHLAPAAYVQQKRGTILDALSWQGIADAPLRDIFTVPPRSRRRATLKLSRQAEGIVIGFHARRSHKVIDIQECHLLTPGLFELSDALRRRLGAILADGETADIHVVEADNGFDLSIGAGPFRTPDRISEIAAFAPGPNIVRVTAGGTLLYESGRPELRFGRATVKFTPGAFLQPTREGEAILQARTKEAVGRAKKVADLFCGCGTFSLPLAEKSRVHAVDNEAPMLEALSAAAQGASRIKPVTVERRDLFALPLSPVELNRFDAAVLDPPRAGALSQAKQLARSRLSRIAYVSCDAASFARDARVLVDGGYELDWIVGVDQFLWSAHVELVAAFSRR